MIVKDEIANLDRCLRSLTDYIACWVIGDTGSADGTPAFVLDFFKERGIPGELHSFPFENFAQARNEALARAYASSLEFDYLLLADADMELVVEDSGFREKLSGPGYTLVQRAGITYWNSRLVRRDVRAEYRGVTHEYLDVPGGGVERLHGVWYRDHASGSSRVQKFERDIRLLLDGLRDEPENRRYWFYLAQSYRDAGRNREAAQTYAKRAEMGGWDEEVWYARLQEARCLRDIGDEGGFLQSSLAAFNQRPQRAEPLYDLARFFRERGMNNASVLFSEAGLTVPLPQQDSLFIENFVYETGLPEEYSIAAYFSDAGRRNRGHAACNWLSLNRDVPVGSRNLARNNLFFYTEPCRSLMPSFAARPVSFMPPAGYRVSSPSVTLWNGRIVLVQRTVNYDLADDGQYKTDGNAPVRTRNFLLWLTAELLIESWVEILPPSDFPQPAFSLVLGFEDLRPFVWQDGLWGCATVRELTAEGWCEQVLARLDNSAEHCRLADWRVLRPDGPRRHEKNWMPQIVGDRLQFIYLCDPTRVVDDHAQTIAEEPSAIAAEDFRGSSQVIEFADGWLALIHEVRLREERRSYRHRFVWFDRRGVLRAVSRGFCFQARGIEFAAGLAWHPDGKRLLVSYSVGDGEAWLATIDAEDVQRVLDDVERLSCDAAAWSCDALGLAARRSGRN